MRIIAGSAGGRRLVSPPGDATRPTSQQIRGAIFNILSYRVADADVLDLFGGTGALALEAMSRGAKSCVISDSSRQAADAIRKNALSVLGEDALSRAAIYKCDWRACIRQVGGRRFDLVFLDPPYAMESVYAEALTALAGAEELAEDCRIVLERGKSRPITLPPGFCLVDERIYGDTAVDFVGRSNP